MRNVLFRLPSASVKVACLSSLLKALKLDFLRSNAENKKSEKKKPRNPIDTPGSLLWVIHLHNQVEWPIKTEFVIENLNN